MYKPGTGTGVGTAYGWGTGTRTLKIKQLKYYIFKNHKKIYKPGTKRFKRIEE